MTYVYPLFPNWSHGIGIDYYHVTTIYTADNRTEQRASLRDRPGRKLTFGVFENALEAVNQLHLLIGTVRTEIAVPVFSEPFKLTNDGDLFGVTTLTVNNDDIQYLYNLQNLTGGLILTWSGVNEYVDLTAIATGALTVSAIASHVDAALVTCYPAVIAFLDAFPSGAHISDNLWEGQLVFNEKRVSYATHGTPPEPEIEWWDSAIDDPQYQNANTGTEYQGK